MANRLLTAQRLAKAAHRLAMVDSSLLLATSQDMAELKVPLTEEAATPTMAITEQTYKRIREIKRARNEEQTTLHHTPCCLQCVLNSILMGTNCLLYPKFAFFNKYQL